MSKLKALEAQLGGRPKKERKLRVYTYLTNEEHEALRRISIDRDLSISYLIRDAVLRSVLNEKG